MNSSAHPTVDSSIQTAAGDRSALHPRPRTAAGRCGPHTGLLLAIQSLLYIIVVAIFIITFLALQPFPHPLRVDGEAHPARRRLPARSDNRQAASAPSTHGGLRCPPKTSKRGEIIVFHYPIDPKLHLVKRVIGIPGDHIKLHDGHVYINGVQTSEPYAIYRPTPPDNFRDNFPRLQTADPEIDSHWWIKMHSLIDHGELTVPPDSYFVLGDNRNDSEDSRYWGFVPRSAIVGKPFLIYFSLRRDAPDTANDLTFHRLEGNASGVQASFMDSLANFARWGRTLRVVN